MFFPSLHFQQVTGVCNFLDLLFLLLLLLLLKYFFIDSGSVWACFSVNGSKLFLVTVFERVETLLLLHTHTGSFAS